MILRLNAPVLPELPIGDSEIHHTIHTVLCFRWDYNHHNAHDQIIYHFHRLSPPRIITRSFKGLLEPTIQMSFNFDQTLPQVQLDRPFSPLPGLKVQSQTTTWKLDETFPSFQWKQSWSRTRLWGMALELGPLQEKLLESDLGQFRHPGMTQSPRNQKQDPTAGNHPKDSQRVCSKCWFLEKWVVSSWPQLRVVFLKDCTTRDTSEHSKSTPRSFPIHSCPLIDG